MSSTQKVADEVAAKLPGNTRLWVLQYNKQDDVIFTNSGIELEMGAGRRNEVLVSVKGLADLIAAVEAGEEVVEPEKVVAGVDLVDPAIEAAAAAAAVKAAAELEAEAVKEAAAKQAAADAQAAEDAATAKALQDANAAEDAATAMALQDPKDRAAD
jgi:hypothetical protein